MGILSGHQLTMVNAPNLWSTEVCERLPLHSTSGFKQKNFWMQSRFQTLKKDNSSSVRTERTRKHSNIFSVSIRYSSSSVGDVMWCRIIWKKQLYNAYNIMYKYIYIYVYIFIYTVYIYICIIYASKHSLPHRFQQLQYHNKNRSSRKSHHWGARGVALKAQHPMVYDTLGDLQELYV